MTLFYMPSASSYGQNVKPFDGSKLYFYEEGTLIPKVTYQDPAETTPHTNPVVANGSGVFPPIYLSGMYKIILRDKNGVQKQKVDNLPGSSVIHPKGSFDSTVNAFNYPASGDLGDQYRVIETFRLDGPSGEYEIVIGDFIQANKDGAVGIDADWDIIRGVQSRSKKLYFGSGVDFTITGDNNWVEYYSAIAPWELRSGEYAAAFYIMGITDLTSSVILSISGIEFLPVGGPVDPKLIQVFNGMNTTGLGGTPRIAVTGAIGGSSEIRARSLSSPAPADYWYLSKGSALLTYKPLWMI